MIMARKTEDGQLKGRVCVTSAAGYVASWLVKRLLSSGYHVTGNVRDPANEKKLAHLWRLQGARERLQLVKANLLEGSFDDAIIGCHGVFHTASPVLKPSDDPKTEILDPAIQVRIKDDFDPRVPLDESSWTSVELCEKLQIWYAMSKTLPEKEQDPFGDSSTFLHRWTKPAT